MDPATLHFLLQQAPTAALALIILALFLAGKIHSGAEYDQLRRDYEAERA